jgi:MYXO-CTERM domain-containing protein
VKRLLSSFAALGFLFFSSDPAEACSPACAVPKLVPVAGATVPASTPGFLFIGYSANASSVQLVDANGAVIAGTFSTDAASGDTYFAPSSPLAPGDYATRSPKACNSTETVDAPFTVTASAPLPTATGSLSLKKSGRETLSAVTSSGSCTEPVDAAYIDLDVAIDPALTPYLSIVTWQTKVDGKWWSKKDPISLGVAPEGNARSYLRLFTPCDGKTSTGRDQGLSAGTHSVEVRAFLPGGAALSPATVTVDLTCNGGDIVGDGEIPGTNGGTNGETSSGGTGFGSGGRSSTSPSSSPSSSSAAAQDGCSSTPNASSSGTSIAAAIVGLLALAGLRRRRDMLE